ncbi:MAG: EAL domain-containing protein, partial [Gammaproteobacteria bacterium]|nr:EAL domain-containing protein [Gammaproteobacteria bacterium]
GLQILEKVLADIQHWDARSEYMPRVAVNVSPVQMRLENSHNELVARIEASGVDSARIEVEVTESAIADGEVCFSFIQKLEQHQIRIALDDFGTGYSSLSQITKLNIDVLKIDQSFVSQLEHSEQVRVLVKTIIQMGHSLGLTLLAEGIETRAQYELLKAWGCDEGQGYLFARPMPADQFSFAPLSLT